MMKKTLLTTVALAALSLPLMSEANPLICPYTDHFYFKTTKQNSEDPLAFIIKANTVGSISYKQNDSYSFDVSCGSNLFKSGTVVVNVGLDSSNMCTLTIEDGPYMNNPSVTSRLCVGSVKYHGITHPFGTHRYYLELEQN